MTNKHIEQGYHEAEQREENFLGAVIMLAIVFLITTLIFISLFINELKNSKELIRQLDKCKDVQSELRANNECLTNANLMKK